MLLRIRSPAGTSRLNVTPETTGEDFAQQMLDALPKSEGPIDLASIKLSNAPGESGEKVTLDALKGRKVGDMGFNHGDLLFLSYKPLEADPNSHPSTQASTSTQQPAQPDPVHAHTHTDPPLPNTIPLVDLSHVRVPEIDQYWATQDGKINRERDPTFCRHGEKGMCDYCMPVEPYDAKYQAENQIKHLSYNAYLKKLLAGRPAASASSSSATEIPPLNPLSLSVVTPCPTASHPPFPAGICSTCQPSALTLTSQSFRMVDHVEMADPNLINGMLDAWRRTGTQRIGFLIGRYDKYEKVPMGVKVVVEAIWEPPQEGEVDGLTVQTPWEEEDRVNEIAGWCEKGLGVTGMIYTDLTPEEDDISKSQYKRHAQSFTASSLEMLLSAAYQVSHPLPTKASPTGHFSSRFVTCCLTGTQEGGIDILAWQATEQAEAMVKAGIVEPTVDPGTVRVRVPGEGEYIPEVFYSYKNEYNIQVKNPARPTFPVEYLFVNLTNGFPVEPKPLFLSNTFPIENRPGMHDQSLEKVVQQLANIVSKADCEMGDVGTWPPRIKDDVRRWLSDWHLVTFLCMQGLLSLEEQKLLCRAATQHAHSSDTAALDRLLASSGWATLLTLAESMAPQPSASGGGANGGSGYTERLGAMGIQSPSHTPAPGDDGGGSGEKVCPHCTFVNTGPGADCDICGLPLSG